MDSTLFLFFYDCWMYGYDKKELRRSSSNLLYNFVSCGLRLNEIRSYTKGYFRYYSNFTI